MGRNWSWLYFYVDEKDKKRSICKFCSHSYGGGHVSRMIKHLRECKKIPSNERAEIEDRISKDLRNSASIPQLGDNVLIPRSQLILLILRMVIISILLLLISIAYSGSDPDPVVCVSTTRPIRPQPTPSAVVGEQ